MSTYTNEDIIRYVEGELSLEEKQKMEADLDAALAARIALYRQLKETLEQRLPDEGAAALRRTLGGMRGRYFAGGGGTSGGSIDTGNPSGENDGGSARVVK